MAVLDTALEDVVEMFRILGFVPLQVEPNFGGGEIKYEGYSHMFEECEVDTLKQYDLRFWRDEENKLQYNLEKIK